MPDTDRLPIPQVLAENKRRVASLSTDYNPYTGEGSSLEREPVQIYQGALGAVVYLPVSMLDDPVVQQIKQHGSIPAAAEALEEEEETYEKGFTELRFAHDFEFWCVSCVKIENEMGETIPFVLNAPQRQSLKDLEALRLAGKPVRIIELKHRQYGSTTMKNAYAAWIQNVLKTGYSAYVCSLDTDGAIEIISRYDRLAEHYPREVGQIRLKPYRGAKNTLEVVGRDGKLNIGSAERPNAPSGRTVQVVLISELGKMKDTPEKGAAKLLTNMMSMVPLRPETFVMLESTAERSGEWFRNEVYNALNDDSGFHLTFINWMTDRKCRMELPEELAPKEFVSSWSDYECRLWEEGATLDQIYWYRQKEKEYQHTWQMKQEYPTFVQEAFQSTGTRKFPPHYVHNVKGYTRPPKLIGDLVADAEKGPDALNNIRFVENPQGNLSIWIHPEYITADHPVANRGAAFADIGGTTEKADWSVLTVLDRYWMMEGGLPERAATWRGHIDQDLFAWKCAQICRWYWNALLAVEVNSLDREKTEGEHSMTILDEIKDHYYYLYSRTDRQKVKEGAPLKWGFHMNHATKGMIVNRLVAATRDIEYIERDIRACNEMDYFEVKEDGSMGAIEGMHDDILDTTAGAAWLALNYMDAPYLDKTAEQYRERKPRQYSEAML